MFGHAATLGAGLGLQPANLTGEPLKIVVAGGHPGDPEYGCGGTIARCAQLGHDIVLLYLNEGEPPGRSRTGTRVAEAKAACELL